MPTQIDYRELLKKYMDLVGEEEGTSFVRQASAPRFTAEEIEALWAIDAETCE